MQPDSNEFERLLQHARDLGEHLVGHAADEREVRATQDDVGEVNRVLVSGEVRDLGARQLRVLTSGRYLRGGWRELSSYLLYRLRYNLRVLPVRENVASHTQRQHTDAFYTLFADQPAPKQGDSAQQ